MAYLKDTFDTTKLDDLCNLLTKEIEELATADYKLKLAYVLIHIIEESQKALSGIITDNTNNFVKELSDLITKKCKEVDQNKKAYSEWFERDKIVMAAIDGTNEDFQKIENEIKSNLEDLDKTVKSLVQVRNNMMPEEVNRSKQKK